MIELKKELIPEGQYCDKCPFFTWLRVYDDIGHISIPYCLYLQQGSYPNNGWDNNEFERLLYLLNQTEEEICNYETGLLGLDLLWDQCKECGINNED
jgi:hypothetical protein